MRLLPPFYALLAVLLLTSGGARAAEPQATKSANAVPLRATSATSEQAPPQNPIQALCRVIFVDVDEGYGVTKQESRTICDEPR
jgi:hypothetical protein